MSGRAYYLQLAHWLKPNEQQSEVIVWPISDGADCHAELAGRLTIGIETGACSVTLRPTRSELVDLVKALVDKGGITAAEVLL